MAYVRGTIPYGRTLSSVMKHTHYLLILFIFLLSACAGSAEQSLPPDPTNPTEDPAAPAESAPDAEALVIEASEPTTEQAEALVTPEIEIPAGAESLVGLAIADLARRMGIENGAVTVVSYEEVVWPDTSLGCPHPEMKYPQIPRDGVLIQLSFEAATYDYHGGGGRAPFLCEQTYPKKDDHPLLDLGDFITP